MYRATCLCAKIFLCRNKIVPKWVHHKCKQCKSNLLVYKNTTRILNFNNKKDRLANSIIRKCKAKITTKINLTTVELPELVPNVSFSDFDSPVKNDVFMGYQFDFGKGFHVESQFELDKISEIGDINK